MSIKTIGLDINDNTITFDMYLSSYSEDSEFEFPIPLAFRLDVEIVTDDGQYTEEDITFDRVVMCLGNDVEVILDDDHAIVEGLEENNLLKKYIFDGTTLQINNYMQDIEADRGDYLYERWKYERADEKLGRG